MENKQIASAIVSRCSCHWCARILPHERLDDIYLMHWASLAPLADLRLDVTPLGTLADATIAERTQDEQVLRALARIHSWGSGPETTVSHSRLGIGRAEYERLNRLPGRAARVEYLEQFHIQG